MKNTKKNIAIIALVAVLGLALVASIASVSAADTETSITATPDESNIFNVNGTGFNASTEVTLKLIANDTTYYTFPENITTDNEGNFTATVIVPTSISGTYNLTASTDDYTAYVEYTVPDLTGPTGATGATGATGTTGQTGAVGAQGEQGEAANEMLGYAGLGMGVVALAVACYAVVRKQ